MKTFIQNIILRCRSPKPGTFKFLAFLSCFALGLIYCSCANLTPAQSSAISTIESNVAQAVADYASTGKVSSAQAIPLALNSISAVIPLLIKNPSTAGTVNTVIASTVTAFTGDQSKSGIAIGQRIAAIIAPALTSLSTANQTKAIVGAGVAASDAASGQTSASTHRTAALYAGEPVVFLNGARIVP